MTDFKSSTSSLTFLSPGISKLHELEKISPRNWTKLRIPSLTKALLQKQQEISTNVEQFTLKVKKKLFSHPPSKLFLSSSVRTCCSPTLDVSKQYQSSLGLRLLNLSLPVVEPIYRIVWKVREKEKKSFFGIIFDTSINFSPTYTRGWPSLPTKSFAV